MNARSSDPVQGSSLHTHAHTCCEEGLGLGPPCVPQILMGAGSLSLEMERVSIARRSKLKVALMRWNDTTSALLHTLRPIAHTTPHHPGMPTAPKCSLSPC
jgi:hypothetical protein